MTLKYSSNWDVNQLDGLEWMNKYGEEITKQEYFMIIQSSIISIASDNSKYFTHKSKKQVTQCVL